jgi:hypothetical protein
MFSNCLVKFRLELLTVEGTSDGHRHDEIGRRNERVSGGVGIVAAGEITVVGRDDGVGLALLHICHTISTCLCNLESPWRGCRMRQTSETRQTSLRKACPKGPQHVKPRDRPALTRIFDASCTLMMGESETYHDGPIDQCKDRRRWPEPCRQTPQRS